MALVRPTPAPFAWAEPFFTFGVTGTNGKTSTTHLLASVARAAGHRTLLLGTVGYYLDEEPLQLPHSREGFFAAFRAAADAGSRWAAVEVTSAALADHYAKRWRFDLGVFTNLSADHLSTHGSYEAYLAAKAQLFLHLGPGRSAVLNAADEHALYLEQAIAPDVNRSWYGSTTRGPLLRPAALSARSVSVSPAGTSIELEPSAQADALGGSIQTRMVGAVFAENALAAAAASLCAGLRVNAICRGLAECPSVPGRFEVLGNDPVAVVDYAHSPDALARTCDQARALAAGKLIVVFGAGGGSTPQKRAPMGRAVGDRADVVFVTNDNPRDEDPQAIAEQLVAGLDGTEAKLCVVLDRAVAIERAMALAGPGDIVVVAGKGHERGQTVEGETLPFCDRTELQRWMTRG